MCEFLAHAFNNHESRKNYWRRAIPPSTKLLGILATYVMTKENSANFLREDPRCKDLHSLINSLYKDLNSFKQNFDCIIRNLNKFLIQNIINQEIYNDCLHIMTKDIIMYLNTNIPHDTLIYKCKFCEKYFLQKDGKFLKEEVCTTRRLNYASYDVCSENCDKHQQRINLTDIIIDNPK